MKRATLPADLSADLDALAALPRVPRGVVRPLAIKYGRTENCIRVLVHYRRHRRNRKRPAGDVRLAHLTPPQLIEYRTLMSKGYRRDEAMAAIGITAMTSGPPDALSEQIGRSAMTDRRRYPRPPAITETQEHAAIAAYFRMVGLGGGAVAFHVRNERPGDWQRINATKMGILPGCPDWIIICDGRVGFIELKPLSWRDKKLVRRTVKLTPHETRQLETHARIERAGAWVEICETLDEVKDALSRHGVPLRTESPIIGGLRKALAEDAAE